MLKSKTRCGACLQLIWDQIQKIEPEIDRESEYGQAWIKGMCELERAQDQALNPAAAQDNLKSYQAAAESFIAAFKLQTDRPEAPLGIAYLLVLLGDDLTAIYYARHTLEQRPDNQEARELLELLESNHRLSALLDDVERLSQGLGLHELTQSKTFSDQEAMRLFEQTELLQQIQHNLLVVELHHGLFKRLDQIHTRQRSLETLYEMLLAHFKHVLSDSQFGERLKRRLDILAFDLESLQNLENLFDDLRQFQKDVQALFREVTRWIIQLRMKQLTDGQKVLAWMRPELDSLNRRRNVYPSAMQHQVAQASGWNHLMSQVAQLEQVIEQASQSQLLSSAEKL